LEKLNRKIEYLVYSTPTISDFFCGRYMKGVSLPPGRFRVGICVENPVEEKVVIWDFSQMTAKIPTAVST
jgi:hypothetical protein